MLVDILINMVLAIPDPEGYGYIEDLKKIRNQYIFKGNFVKDFIVWLPFQFELANLHPVLIIFQFIKAVRFEMLMSYMDAKNVKPIIRKYFDSLN